VGKKTDPIWGQRNPKGKRAGDVAQVVEDLPSKRKGLSSKTNKKAKISCLFILFMNTSNFVIRYVK
jgi:hypothetical protein